jgi:hypothetical protein
MLLAMAIPVFEEESRKRQKTSAKDGREAISGNHAASVLMSVL